MILSSKAEKSKENILKIFPDAREHRFLISFGEYSEDVLIISSKKLGSRWQNNASEAWIDTWNRLQINLIKKLES